MAMKVLKTAKPVAFDDAEQASIYLAGLSDGKYEIEVSSKKPEYVVIFTGAMATRSLNAKRANISSTVFFEWNLIGPATYMVHVSGNEFIPIVWKSKADDLRDRIDALPIGGRLDCSELNYDPFYIRSVLSRLGVQAYTKTENGTMYIVKGSKPPSALKAIQMFVHTLGDEAQVLHVDKPIQYVRTNISRIPTRGYRFSVKELKYGQYLVSKRYDKPVEPKPELFRDKLASVLSPEDLAAYDAILARASAAINAQSIDPAKDEDLSEWLKDAPSYIKDKYADPEPQRTGGRGLDVQVVPAPTPFLEGFVEADPCYARPAEVNDSPSAPDPDEWDAKQLNTSYLDKMREDEEDLPF